MRSAGGKGGSLLLLFVLLILAVVVGGVLSASLQHFPWAGFLIYTKTFGITQPVTLDLSILKISFGFILRIDLVEVLCILAALLLYRRFR